MNNLLSRISINKKIFLSQLCVILVVVPSLFLLFHAFKNVEKLFYQIIDDNLIRIQALLEMKASAAVIQNATEKFVNLNENVPQITLDNSKNELLAQIELLQFWQSRYDQHLMKNMLKPVVFTQLESNIIIETVQIANFKSQRKAPALLQERINNLVKNVRDYKNQVDNLIAYEFDLLEENKKILDKKSFLLSFLLIASILLAILTAMFVTWLLSYFIAKRIIHLKDSAKKIADGDMTIQITQRSQDELGHLENSLDLMLKNIIASNTKLLGSMRAVGMADVANNVLHNVGNVLSSVNVSVDYLKEELSQNKVQNLKKISNLLNENKDNLQAFLSSEKGMLLFNYLEQIILQMENEQAGLLLEASKLTEHVKHIKDIITLEQELTVKVGVVESISLSEMINSCLKIIIPQASLSTIKITKNFAAADKIMVDKIKLEQVLINIIKNAYESLLQRDAPDKKITIKTTLNTDNFIEIEVCDNGMGIKASDCQKVISGGFTTKKMGHGFGLHFSALAMDELGGSLHISSLGEEQGACVLLKLPMREIE